MPQALTIVRGDDYLGVRRLKLTVKEDNGAGALVDLTSTSVRFQVRRKAGFVAALIEKALGSGIELADQTTNRGVAFVEIESAATQGLEAGDYYYEVEATDSVGKVTLASGTLTLVADQIRS